MSRNPTDIINATYMVRDDLVITDAGPADAFGYATVMLSDGSSAWTGYPVKGRVYASVSHPPKIVPLQDAAGWEVTPHGCKPLVVMWSELRRAK